MAVDRQVAWEPVMMIACTLSLRVTRKYVGTWKHLDEHREVGEYVVLSQQFIDGNSGDDYDPCEPQTIVHLVQVTPNEGVADQDIERALADEHSAWDCAHEYDCCGCRSYSVSKVEKVGALDGKPLYRVTQNSSRNF